MARQATTDPDECQTCPDARVGQVRKILRDAGSVLIAYSGGVDSTLLLKLGIETLGQERILAAIVDSPSLPRDELHAALAVARQIGAECLVVPGVELLDPRYRVNDTRRCHVCKSHLYRTLHTVRSERGIARLASGVIRGDDDGTRPGVTAAREAGVLLPLLEAGIDKPMVRRLARRFDLPNADKPATPCLASRIPFGTPVTIDRLARVERAEAALRAMGFEDLRVRDHGLVARVELPVSRWSAILSLRAKVVESLRAAGYVYVSLDLVGLRSGSAHEAVRAASEGKPADE